MLHGILGRYVLEQVERSFLEMDLLGCRFGASSTLLYDAGLFSKTVVQIEHGA